jgi:hypothetical protein
MVALAIDAGVNPVNLAAGDLSLSPDNVAGIEAPRDRADTHPGWFAKMIRDPVAKTAPGL